MFDPQLVTTSGGTHIIDRSSKRLLPSLFADYRNYQQSLELRDLVKDSIYREVQSLSAKSEHIEGRELLRSLSYRHPKDGSSPSISSDPPRSSYDGREVNSTTCYDRFARDGNKFDRRESSTKDGNKSGEKYQNARETQGDRKRLPSVVARLMGLEALPASSSVGGTNVGDSLKVSRLSEKEGSNSNELIRLSSGKNLRKETSCSPRARSVDVSVKKPLERFPIETAPWKQSDKARRGREESGKHSVEDHRVFSPSVYGEIDKRLKELEFLETGKDLRALKQIMEAIHCKGRESQFSSSSRTTDQLITSTTTEKKLISPMNSESQIVIMKPAKLAEKSGIGGLSLPTKLEVGKDRKSNSSSARKVTNQNVNLGGHRADSVDIKNEKNALASTSKRQQSLSKDGNGMCGKKSFGSVSPRTQQKKLDMEKRSRPPTPPSPVKSKLVKPNKKQEVPKSSGVVRRTTPKNPYLQEGSDDQLSESSIASSSSSCYATEIEDSAQSSDVIVHWPPDSEASSSRRSSLTSAEASGPLLKKSNLMLMDEKLGFVPQDYSSPVSVLENINEPEDRCSSHPKKHVRKILQAEESTCKEGGSSMARSELSNGISRKKLENIDNLVQKLRRVNSNHDEVRVDYIASLCDDNVNPDHRYASEILLASGLLLRDFSSNSTDLLQFHPSGYPINPQLYLVLEQTKASAKKGQVTTTTTTNNDKFHRRLIFDTVNEILAKKLSFLSCPPRPIGKLARMPLNAQKLLRELCSEIEGLRSKNPNECSFNDEEDDHTWKMILSEDVMKRSESWVDFDAEISDIILYIERLVFKDLVKETVLGEIVV